MLALGDKLSNIRAMHQDLQVIGDELWKRFNNKDPKEQGMYYCSLANVFREDEEIRKTPAFTEYAALCEEVFHEKRDQNGKKWFDVPDISTWIAEREKKEHKQD